MQNIDFGVTRGSLRPPVVGGVSFSGECGAFSCLLVILLPCVGCLLLLLLVVVVVVVLLLYILLYMFIL